MLCTMLHRLKMVSFSPDFRASPTAIGLVNDGHNRLLFALCLVRKKLPLSPASSRSVNVRRESKWPRGRLKVEMG